MWAVESAILNIRGCSGRTDQDRIERARSCPLHGACCRFTHSWARLTNRPLRTPLLVRGRPTGCTSMGRAMRTMLGGVHLWCISGSIGPGNPYLKTSVNFEHPEPLCHRVVRGPGIPNVDTRFCRSFTVSTGSLPVYVGRRWTCSIECLPTLKTGYARCIWTAAIDATRISNQAILSEESRFPDCPGRCSCDRTNYAGCALVWYHF